MKPHRLFWAALALLLLCNAWILLSVLYNRSHLESSLEISLRELRSAGDHRVSLDWRSLDNFQLSPSLIQEQQPEPASPESRHRDPVTRAALVVLELNGPAYQTQLASTQAALERAAQQHHHAPEQTQFKERLDDARRELKHEQQKASRLFAVDAGSDLAALRQRYPDRRQYAIVPGRVSYVVCAEQPKCGRIDTITLGYFYLPDALKARYLRYPLETKLHFNVGQALQAWLSAEKPLP